VSKNNPILKTVLDFILSHENIDNLDMWWTTGPGAFTYAIAKEHANSLLEKVDTPHSVQFITNSSYRRYFRIPELQYKQTTKAWQVAISAEAVSDGIVSHDRK